jgi:hypothetical protein
MRSQNTPLNLRLRCSLDHFAARLHPDIEERAGDQQEEDTREEEPRQRIGLMEVVPREDHRQTNRGNPDHLALECDAHCTPANIKRDGQFTDSREGE